MMKTAGKIFMTLIIIEAIISIISFNIKFSYPTPCNIPDFLHPFGREIGEGMVCIQVLAKAPSPLFYLSADLLIFTITSYAIYLTINKSKKK